MGPPTRAHRGTDNRSEGRERPPARPSLGGRDLESNERAAQRHSTRHRAAVSKIICLRLHARTTTTVSANRHHRDLLLPDADRFHQQHVEPNGGQQVHGARRRGRQPPPRCPRLDIDRMNTPGSVLCSAIRTRSPQRRTAAERAGRVDGQHGDPPSLLPVPRDQRDSRMDGPTRVARSARLRGGDQRGGLCGGRAGG